MSKVNRKRILIVDHDLDLSGAFVSLTYLIKRLAEEDHEIFVLSKTGKPQKAVLTSIGAKIIDYSASPLKSITLSFHISDKTTFFTVKWIKTLLKDFLYFLNGFILSIKIINTYKPDLIYLNEYVTISFGLFARIKGIPLIVHIRSLFIDQKFNFRIFLLKFALKNISSYNLAITNLEASQIEVNEDSKSKTVVVPEFLTDDDFILSDDIFRFKEEYNLEGYDLIVSFLGGINIIKGSLTFLECIKYISSDPTKIAFMIAGNINASKSKENLLYIKKCLEKISNPFNRLKVKFIGPTFQTKQLLGVTDVLVSCSVQTHFSRPIIEAWAKKKAVIATDISHSKNLITDGINGLLFPINDAIALAEKIDQLFNDPEKRLFLGENGFKEAASKHSGNKNTDIITKLISDVLQKNKL